MSQASVLTDALGPRGERRVKIATGISLAALAAFVVYALWRFQTNGQLDPDTWGDYVDVETVKALGRGLRGTLQAALTAMVLAVVVGFGLALGRLSRNRVVSGASRAVIEFIRGIPVLLFIFFAFLALPDIIGVRLSPFAAVVVALSAYNSAVLAEIFRAGILSLPRGQSEAAFAIGLTYWQAQFQVILPQAVRRMTPAIVAQLATLTKDTALGFVIGYAETLRIGQRLGEFYGSVFQAYIIVAVVYFVLIWLLSRLARRLEVQQRRKLGAGAMHVGGGMEDLEALAEDADEVEQTRPVSDTAG